MFLLRRFFLFQIKNMCEAPLLFHVNKMYVKEGYSLPEAKVTATDETDEPKKDKKGKKQLKKPKTKKKDILQKQYESVPDEWFNHFENEFSLVTDSEDDMFSLVGTDRSVVSVLPGESISFKIQYSGGEKQIDKSLKDKKGKKRSRSETKESKDVSPKDRKRSNSVGDSPGTSDKKDKRQETGKDSSQASHKQKGKKQKTGKDSSPESPKHRGKKKKSLKDDKKKIYVVKYVVTLGNILPVKEWILIVYNKK